jgi:hypothetical protein
MLKPYLYFKQLKVLNLFSKRNLFNNGKTNKTTDTKEQSQVANENKETKDDKVGQGQQEQNIENRSKGTKHIYKKEKDSEYEILRDEKTIYKEGYDEGFYIRERASYSYYEIHPKGKKTESGGKSDTQNENNEKVDIKSENKK